jgi:hypothetical protein
LDKIADANLKLCKEAVQASADEIYAAWKEKKKPSKYQYRAWELAPTLDSAEGPQELQPLFTVKGEEVWKRRTLTNRRDGEKINNGWNYKGVYDEAKNSHWWDYPITMNGPLKIPFHHVTETDSIPATSAEKTTSVGEKKTI